MNAELFKTVVQEMLTEQVISKKDNLFMIIKNMLSDIVTKVVCTHFENRFPALHRYLLDDISDKMDDYFNDTNKLLMELFEMNETPYTQNHYLFENINKNRNKNLQNNILKMLPSINTNI